MFQHLFSRTELFLLFKKFLKILLSLIMTICKCIKKAIIIQQTPHQFPPTTSQEPPTTATNSQTNNAQSSTRIFFQDNPYTFEEKRARLSEPLEPVVR